MCIVYGTHWIHNAKYTKKKWVPMYDIYIYLSMIKII